MIKFCDRRNDPGSVSMHWLYAFIIVRWQSQCSDALLIFKRKLTQAGHMNVAIHTCTKFAVHFVYVDTNNSVLMADSLRESRTVVHEWEC